MRLYIKCKSCSEEISVKTQGAENRIKLAKKKGVEFGETCNSCHVKHQYHIDDIKAEENQKLIKISGFVSVVVAIFLTILLWNLGFIAWASMALPIVVVSALMNNERTNKRAFNDLYYDRFRKK